LKSGKGNEMDTLTMVEEAMANPGQIFEAMCCTVNDKVHNKQGLLKWVNSKHAFLISETTMSYKWRRVSKPIRFTNALMAHDDRKTIICELGDRKSVYDRENAHLGLVNNKGHAITTLEILEGVWYVVED